MDQDLIRNAIEISTIARLAEHRDITNMPLIWLNRFIAMLFMVMSCNRLFVCILVHVAKWVKKPKEVNGKIYPFVLRVKRSIALDCGFEKNITYNLVTY